MKSSTTQGGVDWAEATRVAFAMQLWRLRHRGRALLKLPTDLWVFAEVIANTHPEVIVETGSHEGGSAVWFADQGPKVISIDTTVPAGSPGITFIQGRTVDVGDEVASLVNGRRCMVVLDSDHNAEYVTQELKIYAPMVTAGCYLVVEDTAVDTFGVDAPNYEHGGPGVALAAFLEANQGWVIDQNSDRFGLTMNPGGWVKRL